MDMHTLHIEHATLLGLATLLTLANSRLHRGARGVFWFPLFNLFAFLGALLVVLRGSVPVPLSIVGGSFCFSLAYIFLHRSVTEFFGRRAFQSWVQIALAGLSLVVLIEYGVLRPHTALRLVWYSLILCAQVSLSAVFVLRHARRHLFESAGSMGLVLAALSLGLLVRVAGTVLYGAPENYTEGSPLLNLSLLVISVLQGGMAIAFVWMTTADLRHDLQILASTDPLTRLLNRRAIELAADQEIVRSDRTGRPLAAILIDLDGFKRINDSFGHSRGDAILRAVALCLAQSMRERDQLARLGGDEFVVLLPSTSQPTATVVAERLRSCLETVGLDPDPHLGRIHASFGVAVRGPGQDWSQLMAACDRALYEAKHRGGDLVLVSKAWEPSAIAG